MSAGLAGKTSFVASELAELNVCRCRVWLDKEGTKASPEQSG